MMGCLLCGSARGFRLRHVKDGYRIQDCAACGLTQLHPVPDEAALAEFYDDSYFESSSGGRGYGDYAGQEAEYLATFGDDVERIREFAPSGQVLDVGCGYGYFVRAALDAGYDAYGTDIAARAIRTAEAMLPGRVFLGRIADMEVMRYRKFRVIFASHLIEHIPDPVAFTSDLAQRLEPGGIIMFVTPNIGSRLARISGARWVSFKIPEHLAFYNPATIRELFRRAGLETLAVDPAHQYYRLPFVAGKVRALIRPLDRLLPPIEKMASLRDRIVCVTSGSLRAIARRGDG